MILLKHKLPDTGDLVIWNWTKGKATLKADFGDPLTDTSYMLCVYEETGGVSNLRVTAHIPAGDTCTGRPCWKMSTRGFTYLDKEATPQGVIKLALKEGYDGIAKIALKAKGANIDMPGLPLAENARVTVQLKSGSGLCWDAEYSAPALKNDQVQFRDKSD